MPESERLWPRPELASWGSRAAALLLDSLLAVQVFIVTSIAGMSKPLLDG